MLLFITMTEIILSLPLDQEFIETRNNGLHFGTHHILYSGSPIRSASIQVQHHFCHFHKNILRPLYTALQDYYFFLKTLRDMAYFTLSDQSAFGSWT